jgi:hypothetical protein
LVKLDEDEEAQQPSFFNWFGFRGAIGAAQPPSKGAGNGADGEDDEDDEDDEDPDQMLEVEIFPAGEELATILADELWSDAVDYYGMSLSSVPPSCQTHHC